MKKLTIPKTNTELIERLARFYRNGLDWLWGDQEKPDKETFTIRKIK